ncbi:MAG: hypothetical protein ACJA2W_001325 [Planctomycetota bacterium]|jgi:hypothetical protein
MTFQYSLRFESGERRGEVVPLTIVAAQGGSFTIGRNPGNTLQVTDVSISGRHAELQIGADGVSLRDLSSTNGTLVGGRKVRQTSLETGDEFMLGAVEFTLVDAASGASAPSPPAASSDDLDDLDELVLEDPDDVAPAASMPRKAPASPAAAPAQRRPAAAAAAAPAPAPQAEGLGNTHILPQEDGLEITAEDIARSAKSSKLGPILLVGLAAVGGGAWWWVGQRSGGDGGDGASRAAVTQPSASTGNFLTKGYSFEKSEGWTSDSDAPAEFTPVRSARRSGARGIQADLAGGESAIIESDAVRIALGSRSKRPSYMARGFGRVDSGIELRLGLRYSSGSGDDALTTTVWSEACATGEDFEEFTFAGTAPSGMTTVQVLVRADSTDAPPAVDVESEPDSEESFGDVKSVSVDDVELVPASDAPATISLDTYDVTSLGANAGSKALAITTLDQSLISLLRVAQAGLDSDSTGLGSQTLALQGDGGAVQITPGGPGTLHLRAEETLASGGIATMSAAGYASHGSTFERSGVTGLILGDDARMIAIDFDEPVDLVARATGSGVTIRAKVPGSVPVVLKTSFMEERTRAQRLARRAKEERSGGDNGAAFATWNVLLTEVPYETRLIGEAATAQTEMLTEGRTQLKGLAAEVERARFFGLADLFREKLARAEDLGRRFRGTDVETQAVALRDVIQLELAALDSNSERDELQRLEAIETVMRRRGAADLASRLDAYRSKQASGSAPGASQNPTGGQ